jgi:hypothetical protein
MSHKTFFLQSRPKRLDERKRLFKTVAQTVSLRSFLEEFLGKTTQTDSLRYGRQATLVLDQLC